MQKLKNYTALLQFLVCKTTPKQMFQWWKYWLGIPLLLCSKTSSSADLRLHPPKVLPAWPPGSRHPSQIMVACSTWNPKLHQPTLKLVRMHLTWHVWLGACLNQCPGDLQPYFWKEGLAKFQLYLKIKLSVSGCVAACVLLRYIGVTQETTLEGGRRLHLFLACVSISPLPPPPDNCGLVLFLHCGSYSDSCLHHPYTCIVYKIPESSFSRCSVWLTQNDPEIGKL